MRCNMTPEAVARERRRQREWQARYKTSLRASGLSQKTVWIPSEDSELLKAWVKRRMALRERGGASE